MVNCGSCCIFSSENRIHGDQDQDLRGVAELGLEPGPPPSSILPKGGAGGGEEGDGPCCTCLEKRKPAERVE